MIVVWIAEIDRD